MNAALIRRRFMAAASTACEKGVWPLRWPGGDGRACVATDAVTVATFNVLADQYAHGGFHSHLEPLLLGWEHRLPHIIEQIEALEADLLALQEVRRGGCRFRRPAAGHGRTPWPSQVERPFFEQALLPHMRALGYDGWLQTRRRQPATRLGAGNVAPKEGVALFVRRGRLRADLVHRVRLADLLPPCRWALC